MLCERCAGIFQKKYRLRDRGNGRLTIDLLDPPIDLRCLLCLRLRHVYQARLNQPSCLLTHWLACDMENGYYYIHFRPANVIGFKGFEERICLSFFTDESAGLSGNLRLPSLHKEAWHDTDDWSLSRSLQ